MSPTTIHHEQAQGQHVMQGQPCLPLQRLQSMPPLELALSLGQQGICRCHKEASCMILISMLTAAGVPGLQDYNQVQSAHVIRI